MASAFTSSFPTRNLFENNPEAQRLYGRGSAADRAVSRLSRRVRKAAPSTQEQPKPPWLPAGKSKPKYIPSVHSVDPYLDFDPNAFLIKTHRDCCERCREWDRRLVIIVKREDSFNEGKPISMPLRRFSSQLFFGSISSYEAGSDSADFGRLVISDRAGNIEDN